MPQLPKRDEALMNLWWGYLHINGTVQVKRAFGNPTLNERDLDEARESPFVSRVFSPFEAESREAAIKHINHLLDDSR